jgi:hypothetical protein
MTPLHVDRLAASNSILWPHRPRPRQRWPLWVVWLALAGAAIALIVSG